MMDPELEWDIRRKMADIQLFLTSGGASEADHKEINVKLDQVIEIVNRSKSRGLKCEA